MKNITHNLSRKSSKAKKDSKSITEIYNNNGLLNSDSVIIYLVKTASCKKLLEHILAHANRFFFASSKDL